MVWPTAVSAARNGPTAKLGRSPPFSVRSRPTSTTMMSASAKIALSVTALRLPAARLSCAAASRSRSVVAKGKRPAFRDAVRALRADARSLWCCRSLWSRPARHRQPEKATATMDRCFARRWTRFSSGEPSSLLMDAVIVMVVGTTPLRRCGSWGCGFPRTPFCCSSECLPRAASS